MSQKPHLLVVVHQFDPRGRKVGGIETHVRTHLERHPDDFDILLLGVDEAGDLVLGQPQPLAIGSRTVTFIPVAQFGSETISEAAKKLTDSLTLRFALGLVRYFPTIRRVVGKRSASVELQRYEHAWLGPALRRPAISVVHNEYARTNKTDSLSTRFWFLHRAAETFALKTASGIIAVNENIARHVTGLVPATRDITRTMSVSVDTRVFTPLPIAATDKLRLIYAGRLEAQKDPGLMFETIAVLAHKLDGLVEFHYAGTSNPAVYPEFAPIADKTVRCGFQNQAGIRAILAQSHVGLLTSNFEGLPCFILETMASGRPMAAIRLPQFDGLIVDGTTGVMTERQASQSESARVLADAIVRLWSEIRAGRYEPSVVARAVEPYSVDRQLPHLFAMHRDVQIKRFGPSGDVMLGTATGR